MHRFKNSYYPVKKHLSTCLVGIVALLAGSAAAYAAASAPALGAAAGFAVLGGTNVTCTNGVVIGDLGVSPGGAVPYTNTSCTISGGVPPATNAAATSARSAFLSAYAAMQNQASACINMPGNLASQNLAPGVYCLDATAKAGTLTLDGQGNVNAVWVFLVNGALTGTNFSVVMSNGGQPCDVFWAPSGATTMTNSAFEGNILAGNATNGSITLTGGTLSGRALANVGVTMTGASVIGCDALSGAPSNASSCRDRGRDGYRDNNNSNSNNENDGKSGNN